VEEVNLDNPIAQGSSKRKAERAYEFRLDRSLRPNQELKPIIELSQESQISRSSQVSSQEIGDLLDDDDDKGEEERKEAMLNPNDQNQDDLKKCLSEVAEKSLSKANRGKSANLVVPEDGVLRRAVSSSQVVNEGQAKSKTPQRHKSVSNVGRRLEKQKEPIVVVLKHELNLRLQFEPQPQQNQQQP